MCLYVQCVCAHWSQRNVWWREKSVIQMLKQQGQYTSFDKADGQHLSDFDATSHIWLSSYKKTFDHLLL